MKVLVIGGGGREHALVWKIAQSPLVKQVWCTPGNAGTATCGDNLPISAEDIDALLDFVNREDVDLTIVGPEAPLVMGIVDRFEKAGRKIFGPSAEAAQIEGSKAFCKSILDGAGASSAAYQLFTDPDEAKAYIREQGAPIVVKADGLAAGKGAIVCATISEAENAVDDILVERRFGSAGDRLIVEECLVGEEASFLVLSDGEHVLALASSQDHKPVGDGDTGPNTGGMGAYSPAPVVTPDLHERIIKQIIEPTVREMARRGHPYKGVLYAGLMIENGVPKVLEYNARFGDPECQPLLFRMKSDIVPLLLASIDGTLDQHQIEWDERPAVCVVMASGGYPDAYEKGKEISGLESALPDTLVFHAGTKLEEGRVVTSGGRVLGVTARAADIPATIDLAYEAVRLIGFNGANFRTDIGKKALKWLGD
ncbi:MAG: phosphoribosylamine--glycine ligase [Candidatus Lernaella stagnicola]|nr:phosphoribosylamine--glycine ligase [Candidatus Lernaella stagnicola]